MDQAKRGAEALSAGKFDQAIKEYTAAIKVSPESPDYHIKRSVAYQRCSPPDHANALSDAEKGVVFASKRAKRELIIDAQLRRAIALFALERYADATFVLDIVKRLDPKEKTLPIWENKIALKMGSLDDNHVGRIATVKEIPDISSVKEDIPKISSVKEDIPKISSVNEATPTDLPLHTATTTTTTPQVSATSTVAQTTADKIRHEWYQNSQSVTFTLFAKGVPKETAVIDIQSRSLSLTFPLANGSTFEFSLDPLYGPVDASTSTYNITPSKVEVVLKKAQPGLKWHVLESAYVVPISSSGEGSLTSNTTISVTSVPPTTQGPVYPTSSRSGPKNWDQLAENLTSSKKNKQRNKSEDDKDAKAKDDDDDDYDYDAQGGDEVNNFFSKLYAGADPDTKRAMMKSFSESNGTALSTNWDEVRKQKMETTPPTGMEAKKWNA